MSASSWEKGPLKENTIMVDVAILCPYHAEEETITLPDSYTGIGFSRHQKFEGDIPCNPSDKSEKKALLSVLIHFSNPPFVERLVQKSP